MSYLGYFQLLLLFIRCCIFLHFNMLRYFLMMIDIVNFTLFNASYSYIPLNILGCGEFT